MLFTLFATMALSASAPIDQPLQAIGCHPQPGKVMGCVTNSHVVAQQRAMGTAPVMVAKADNANVERTIACHPDPSRNRGCFRAAPAAQMKPAVARAKAQPAQESAEADTATASQGSSLPKVG
ncbi:hypothetical protein [Novosphingobium rosa]|uniref:hypothetical protein n=1 Tax=Novosphingobium rosa TaxID=76978 RepID=UPI000835F2A1|nr:hypothetical protein [Novosphingobium rosa]